MVVDKGSYTVLTGPSGCGKTTLAHALSGILHNSLGGEVTGTITVAGEDIASVAPARLSELVSFVWQFPDRQMCARTVANEACLPLDFRNVEAAVGDAAAAEMLATVGLGHISCAVDPLALSGGQQQRLALAAAIVQNTPLLILDEATAALDADGAARFKEILANLRRNRDLTVLAIDHMPARHDGLADRILVMDQHGRIVTDAPFVPPAGLPVPLCRTFGVRTPHPKDLPPAQQQSPDTHPPQTPVLKLVDAGYRLDGTTILEPVSLILRRGDTAVVRGPNGAGKTTLLRMIAGEITGTGTIVPDRRKRLEKGIAWVDQRSAQLTTGRSVDEEMVGAVTHGQTTDPARLTDKQRDEIDTLLATAGLDDLRGRHPLRLSGGQQQRLAVAAAVAQQPEILLCDEPTTAQDADGVAAIAGLLRFHSHTRATVVVTHDDFFAASVHPCATLVIPAAQNTLPQPGTHDAEPDTAPRYRSFLHPLTLVAILVTVWLFAVRHTSFPELGFLAGAMALVALWQAVVLAADVLVKRLLALTAGCAVSWCGFALWIPRGPDPQTVWPGFFLSNGQMEAALLPTAQLWVLGFSAISLMAFIDGQSLRDSIIRIFKVPYRYMDTPGYARRFATRIRRDSRRAAHKRKLTTRGRPLLLWRVKMLLPVVVASLTDSGYLSDALDGKGFGLTAMRTLRHARPLAARDTAALVLFFICIAAAPVFL
nr:ATP-binding cassette domain-containing protein [Corynebacterium mendelii]